jgi:1-acyl-sn-glycerol-3-phosphate acyltransferase
MARASALSNPNLPRRSAPGAPGVLRRRENEDVASRRRTQQVTKPAGEGKIARASSTGHDMAERGLASELVGSIPGVRLLGGVLPEKQAASTFFGRWVRRGIMASFGVGFSVPYFSILNDVHVEGDEIFPELPKRNVVFLSNHQTYFMEAIAFFDLVYVRHQMPLENPLLRFSAAEETMKKNLLTRVMSLVGGVTFKRSFREGGVDVQRPVDLEGVSRVEEAIRDGWLLHFPAGTTKKGAPLRSGVSRLLHNSRAVAIPVRIDGFRELLLHKQLPGKVFRSCSVKIHRPLDLEDFYAEPYRKDRGSEVLEQLESMIGDS